MFYFTDLEQFTLQIYNVLIYKIWIRHLFIQIIGRMILRAMKLILL